MRSIALALCTLSCGRSSPAPQAAPAPEPPGAEATPPVRPKASKDADISLLSDDERRAFLMELGQRVYLEGDGGIACVTCHQPTGLGITGAFPPLVGQKEWMGDCIHHAGLILRGLQGEVVVAGVKYNGVMMPQGDALNDLQIASVTSYVRNSWGNDYGLCAPSDVATARAAPDADAAPE